MTRSELADIMGSGEKFNEEIYIQKEKITNEFLALANGFKACGGEVYILQTYDLRSIIFEDQTAAYNFFAWAVTKTVKC